MTQVRTVIDIFIFFVAFKDDNKQRWTMSSSASVVSVYIWHVRTFPHSPHSSRIGRFIWCDSDRLCGGHGASQDTSNVKRVSQNARRSAGIQPQSGEKPRDYVQSCGPQRAGSGGHQWVRPSDHRVPGKRDERAVSESGHTWQGRGKPIFLCVKTLVF